MYIPRPAKLFFTPDDGWNKFLGKFGDSVSECTKLSVERMLACGAWPWAFAATVVLSRTAHTPASTARAASQKPAAPVE